MTRSPKRCRRPCTHTARCKRGLLGGACRGWGPRCAVLATQPRPFAHVRPLPVPRCPGEGEEHTEPHHGAPRSTGPLQRTACSAEPTLGHRQCRVRSAAQHRMGAIYPKHKAGTGAHKGATYQRNGRRTRSRGAPQRIGFQHRAGIDALRAQLRQHVLCAELLHVHQLVHLHLSSAVSRSARLPAVRVQGLVTRRRVSRLLCVPRLQGHVTRRRP